MIESSNMEKRRSQSEEGTNLDLEEKIEYTEEQKKNLESMNQILKEESFPSWDHVCKFMRNYGDISRCGFKRYSDKTKRFKKQVSYRCSQNNPLRKKEKPQRNRESFSCQCRFCVTFCEKKNTGLISVYKVNLEHNHKPYSVKKIKRLNYNKFGKDNQEIIDSFMCHYSDQFTKDFKIADFDEAIAETYGEKFRNRRKIYSNRKIYHFKRLRKLKFCNFILFLHLSFPNANFPFSF